MSSAASKVSFTIRRPTPLSRASSTGADSDTNSNNFKVPAIPRHVSSANSSAPGSPSPLSRESPTPKRTYHERDSSDEDEGVEDELVTGFDQFGVQRVNAKPEPAGPLVIPALKNRDWRDVARKRKQLYVPPSAQAATGADGSVGGLGTKDTINSGPQLSGLQLVPNKKARLDQDGDENMEDPGAIVLDNSLAAADGASAGENETKPEETEDERALRALLSSAQRGDTDGDYTGPIIDIIPAAPVTEDDAYKQDVASLPDLPTLDDYERVPVSQFGAALLRGMGWKEGEVASRSKRFQGKDGKKAMVEPWLPTARPALLGIGAKEKEALDDGSRGKGKKGKGRPDKRYIPVVKVERNGSGDINGNGEREIESRSGSSSRRRSPEPSGGSSRRSLSSDKDRRRDRERGGGRNDRDRYGSEDARDKERRRERESFKDDRYRDEGRDRDRRQGDRRDNGYDSSSRRERDSDRRKEKERERSPDRDKYGDSSSRRKDRDRRDY